MSNPHPWKHDQTCAEIRDQNSAILAEFQSWLSDEGLTPATVRRHVENIEEYVNTYLLSKDATPAAAGIDQISLFFSYWLIRHAKRAAASSIRQYAASLKKFYSFMERQGSIKAEELKELKETIREEMPDWLRTVERYKDPAITDPGDIWGF